MYLTEVITGNNLRYPGNSTIYQAMIIGDKPMGADCRRKALNISKSNGDQKKGTKATEEAIQATPRRQPSPLKNRLSGTDP